MWSTDVSTKQENSPLWRGGRRSLTGWFTPAWERTSRSNAPRGDEYGDNALHSLQKPASIHHNTGAINHSGIFGGQECYGSRYIFNAHDLVHRVHGTHRFQCLFF